MTWLAVALGAGAAVWVPLFVWIRRRAQRAREELASVVGERAVHLAGGAGFLGRRSAGLGQVRGTGQLALTGDELVFVQLVPSRTLRIRRDAIEAVDTPRWFLTKSSGRRLLRVRWRDGDGTDEAAWQVPDLDSWLEALGAHAAEPPP